MVTENENWEVWILYILDMFESTVKKGVKRLEEILGLMEAMSQQIKEELPKIHSKELIEIIFRLPYRKRQHFIDAKFGTPKKVGNYLKALEEHGFLKSVKLGKEKLCLNYSLMQVLEK